MAFSISKYSHPSTAPVADTDNFKSKKSRPSYLFENMAQASGCLIGRVGTLLNPTPLKDDVLKNLFTFNDVLDIWLDDPRATGNKLEATSRIKHTAETRSKFLDLSDLDLNTSPPLGALKSHLISIDFSNNKLTEIPAVPAVKNYKQISYQLLQKWKEITQFIQSRMITNL